MTTFDANRVLELEWFGPYWLGAILLLTAIEGHDAVAWDEHDQTLSVGSDDGESRSLFGYPQKTSVLETLTQAVEALALAEGPAPRTGRFLLVVGERRIEIDVHECVNGPHRAISLRAPGLGAAKEQARAILSEFLKEPPLILSSDGRILGRGKIRPRYRTAAFLENAAIFAWYSVFVAAGSMLAPRTPLLPLVGVLGGLVAAFSAAGLVFARRGDAWKESLLDERRPPVEEFENKNDHSSLE